MKRDKLILGYAILSLAVLDAGCGATNTADVVNGKGDSNADRSDNDDDASNGYIDPDQGKQDAPEYTDFGPGLPISGKVMAPSGTFPISGALVYLSPNAPPPIPDGVYHYECDKMDGIPYTLSGPDGSWQIPKAPYGKWKLVTRKGNFRRVRDIEIRDGMDTTIPQEWTTLPARNNHDGTDRIPSCAVLRTNPDFTYNLLAKFGMGQLDASGRLIDGTETFAIYEDERSSSPASGNPSTKVLFTNKQSLHKYQMIFLPCSSTQMGIQGVLSHADMLRQYVAEGGRIYNSCTVALWTKAPFPDYITYMGSNDLNRFDIGRTSATNYFTTGTVTDNGLAEWLTHVISDPTTAVPFKNGFVGIQSLNEINDGHGLEKDGKAVKPYMWVRDNSHHIGAPLMVTYNYDFGKVFYSVYETSSSDSMITPQEYVLLYVILEVGVCANLPSPPDIK